MKRLGATAGRRRPLRRLLQLLTAVALLLCATAAYHRFKPLPPGLSFAGPARAASDVRFLRDWTYLDSTGQRRTEQQIFAAVFELIDQAEEFVLIDMFLFNDFQGAKPETTRALSGELTDRLIARKTARPDLEAHVISDPINTVYGGLRSPHFARLHAAGISVTLTDHSRLRDSNPLYSTAWRWIASPLGNGSGRLLPNPFGAGRVSLRSYLALLNFKANHRKIIIADGPQGLVGLVTSANPHDGSSAHANVALRFDGAAAHDLLAAEKAVLAFSRGPVVRYSPQAPAPAPAPPLGQPSAAIQLRILTESQIERAACFMLDQAPRSGTSVTARLAMFYLSDRRVINALRAAAARGIRLRLILDPNKDAFGHRKNGIPNRQVAAELVSVPGIEIRWADTHGEQCHSKMLLVHTPTGQSTLLLGSANFTRRNLDDYNLELDALATGPEDAEVFRQAEEYFDAMWHNTGGRSFTVGYEVYADPSIFRYWRYRVMEASGISTF